MALIDDVVAYLAAQGLGVYGQDLFVDAIPDEPDDVVGLYVSTDAPPPGRRASEWLSIEVVARSRDYEAGEARAINLFNALVYPPGGFMVVEGRHAVSRWVRSVGLAGYDANRRPVLGFTVEIEHAEVDTAGPDPWLDALAEWLEAALVLRDPRTGLPLPWQLGGAWAVYKHEWPRDFARPAVLVRLDSESFKPHNRLYVFRRLTVAVHVLGRAPKEQDAAVGAIVAGLQQAVKIVGGRHHLTVENVTAQYAAEPFRQGQIRVTFSGGIKVEELPVDLMWHIYAKGVWKV